MGSPADTVKQPSCCGEPAAFHSACKAQQQLQDMCRCEGTNLAAWRAPLVLTEASSLAWEGRCLSHSSRIHHECMETVLPAHDCSAALQPLVQIAGMHLPATPAASSQLRQATTPTATAALSCQHLRRRSQRRLHGSEECWWHAQAGIGKPEAQPQCWHWSGGGASGRDSRK